MQPFDVAGRGTRGTGGSGAGPTYEAFSNSEWAADNDEQSLLGGSNFHRRPSSSKLALPCEGLTTWWWDLGLRQRKVAIIIVATVISFLILLLVVVVPAAVHHSAQSDFSTSPLPPRPPPHAVSTPSPVIRGPPSSKRPSFLTYPPSPPVLAKDPEPCSWSSFYLPEGFIHPIQYDLVLAVRNSDWAQDGTGSGSGSDGGKEDGVNGHVSIHVHVQRTASCIVLHALGMNISDVSFTLGSDKGYAIPVPGTSGSMGVEAVEVKDMIWNGSWLM